MKMKNKDEKWRWKMKMKNEDEKWISLIKLKLCNRDKEGN